MTQHPQRYQASSCAVVALCHVQNPPRHNLAQKPGDEAIPDLLILFLLHQHPVLQSELGIMDTIAEGIVVVVRRHQRCKISTLKKGKYVYMYCLAGVYWSIHNWGVEWEATQWYRMTLLDGELEMEAAKWPISSLR